MAGRKSKTTVFTMCFASGSKNHGVYNVVWPANSKKNGIYAGFTMLQDVVSISEKDKSVNYNVLCLLLGCVGGAGQGGTEMASNLLINQVAGLAALPFTSSSKTQGSPTGATFRDIYLSIYLSIYLPTYLSNLILSSLI